MEVPVTLPATRGARSVTGALSLSSGLPPMKNAGTASGLNRGVVIRDVDNPPPSRSVWPVDSRSPPKRG